MIFKYTKLDGKKEIDINYSLTDKNFISNKNLAKEIQDNINFVEKYFNKVDSSFTDNKERTIVYKQLGIMVFSCIEALWKSIVLTINKNCRGYKTENHTSCKKCNSCKSTKNPKENACDYYKFNTNKKINDAHTDVILKYLNDVRLLSVQPYEFCEISQLKKQRNHIHLTRILLDDNMDARFTKNYVKSLLRIYYETLNQTIHSGFYFNEPNQCLKKLDENSLKDSASLHNKHLNFFLNMETLNICSILLNNAYYAYLNKSDLQYIDDRNINDEHKSLLNNLSNKRINFDLLISHLGKLLYFKQAQFKQDRDYEAFLDIFYKKLEKYLGNNTEFIKSVNEKINEYKQEFNS